MDSAHTMKQLFAEISAAEARLAAVPPGEAAKHDELQAARDKRVANLYGAIYRPDSQPMGVDSAAAADNLYAALVAISSSAALHHLRGAVGSTATAATTAAPPRAAAAAQPSVGAAASLDFPKLLQAIAQHR
jgi:hypothetical protein